MKMLCKAICLLVVSHIAIGYVVEPPVDFSQHKIIRILPIAVKQFDALEKIKSDFNVDFWNPPMTDLRPVLTLISPEQIGFLSALNGSNIKYEVAANSFQKVIDAEREENERNKKLYTGRALNYNTQYHTYDEINLELQTIAASDPRVTYRSIGTSFQGRAIPSITITNTGGSGKKSIFLECGIHAREWISTASCLWISNELLTNTANNALLNTYEFVIVPSVNVDGYVYTWVTNRQWRKTRTGPVNNCYGGDPNRNWDTAWCANGASTNPCSETYCGQSAFSEPCAKAMSTLIQSKQGNIAAYISIHSYSQIWMWPWGYTNTLPPNNADLARLSQAAVTAIKNTNGLDFTQGSIANAIYLASGSSIDWAYDKVGVKIAYALELRDKGQYGFVLPPAQILAACTETWNGIKAAINLLPSVQT